MSINFLPDTHLRDLIVLAVNAETVAVGKEDGPGTARPGDGGFLAKMREKMRNFCLDSALAESKLAIRPVDMAASGTQVAGSHYFFGFNGPFIYFSLLVENCIGRNQIFSP
jgi:hypothetical protein